MAKGKFDIEKYFFIDFQNITKEALNGIEKLGKNDRVRIYYGKNAAHIPFDLHVKISECEAEFEYVKVEFTIKNALDCMIIYDIRAFMGVKSVKEYYIISNDTDFDNPIVTFTEAGLKISRIGSVEDSNTVSGAQKSSKAKEKKCADKVGTFFDENFTEKKYKQKKDYIISAVKESSDRGMLNNKLQQLYDSGDVKIILKTLKPLTNELYKKKNA
ncbi:MAG: NYN domain-containing protein [Ruminiclostridium sp.]|nr:NYN domain-containing protein [Ruminiclostridium sp.]